MTDDINPAGQDTGDSEVDPESTPLEQFIFHQRRGLEEFGKAMDSLLPPGFKEHTQAAGSEFATGFRVLIDAAIDEIKKASEMEDPQQQTQAQAAANLAADDDDDAPPAPSSRIKVELED